MKNESTAQPLFLLRLRQWLRTELLLVFVLTIPLTPQGPWQDGPVGGLNHSVACNGNGGGCG